MSKDPIREKIAALRRLARDSGASEAEALAAAEKAAQLMREHQISDIEPDFDEEDIAWRTRGSTPRDCIIGVVATCTNTAALMRGGKRPSAIFIGQEPGPVIAAYLAEVIGRAMDAEVEAFKGQREYLRRRTVSTRRAAVQDFTIGLVHRLNQRLVAMFADTMSPEARRAALRARDLRFPGSQPVAQRDQRIRFGSAAASGYAAGERINLSHATSKRADPLLLGRG